LTAGIAHQDWVETEAVVSQLIMRLLDASNHEGIFQISPKKKQERELFVALGGMRQLLRLFEPPLCEVDARLISAHSLGIRAELWNEVLILIRELCFTVPSLAEHIFSSEHIALFFSFLSHKSMFENALNILEEILAVKTETFDLYKVPNLYSLLNDLSIRQLAHFCRVLALVLFEPEDRQMIECSHVIKSLDIIQLRRDRMAKSASIVERNQSLIIEMPNMLGRLILLCKIINHGPDLSDLLRHNIIAQFPLSRYECSFN
jgi:Trpc4-associated protein